MRKHSLLFWSTGEPPPLGGITGIARPFSSNHIFPPLNQNNLANRLLIVSSPSGQGSLFATLDYFMSSLHSNLMAKGGSDLVV